MGDSNKEEVEKETGPIKAVFYTDGGCKPSRGFGGYGVHGYFYVDGKPKQGAGAKAIPTKEGYVVGAKEDAVSVQEYLDCAGGIEGEATNNIAEMLGVKRALEIALEKKVSEILILTDSNYVLKGLTQWVAGWIKKGWIKSDGNPVENKDQWLSLLETQELIKNANIKLKIDKVRGHSGDLGNTEADKLASAGILMARKGVYDEHIQYSEPKGYWTIKVEYNRLLSKANWYFLTGNKDLAQAPDGRFVYHLGSHGPKDALLGKPMSDASYSVVYLKESDSVLDKVRDVVDDNTDLANQVVIGRLSNITVPNNYSNIEKNGGLHLECAPDRLDIKNYSGVTITTEQRPARLSYRMLEAMNTMEALLEDYLNGRTVTVTDITDDLYDKEEKKGKIKCKLKKEVTVSTKYADVDVNYVVKGKTDSIDVRLLLGLDLPDRNTLASLAPNLPSVKVITWKESDKAFRFATIVEVDGDVGIFSSFYSNLRLLID